MVPPTADADQPRRNGCVDQQTPGTKRVTLDRFPSDEMRDMGECDPGLKDVEELEVLEEHTAAVVGSGDVPVLATPIVLALAERACVRAIAGELPEDQTSVGAFAEIEHERPTCVGARVTAEATLIGHHGRRLEFQVMVRDGETIVARVRHRRVIVHRQRFLDKLAQAGGEPDAEVPTETAQAS
jgi:predicted thioesterase